jgi:hypothetical protein
MTNELKSQISAKRGLVSAPDRLPAPMLVRFPDQAPEEAQPRTVHRELDLSDYVVADFAFPPATFGDNIERGVSVNVSMKKHDYRLHIFPDVIHSEGSMTWECKVVAPFYGYCRSVFDGRATFFRDTRLINIKSTDHGGLWMLLAPAGQGSGLKLDDYVIGAISFPDQCSIEADEKDKGLSATESMNRHGYTLEIVPGRGACQHRDVVERQCKVSWPFSPGLVCVSYCQATFKFATGDIDIESGIDDKLEISLSQRRRTE